MRRRRGVREIESEREEERSVRGRRRGGREEEEKRDERERRGVREGEEAV